MNDGSGSAHLDVATPPQGLGDLHPASSACTPTRFHAQLVRPSPWTYPRSPATDEPGGDRARAVHGGHAPEPRLHARSPGPQDGGRHAAATDARLARRLSRSWVTTTRARSSALKRPGRHAAKRRGDLRRNMNAQARYWPSRVKAGNVRRLMTYDSRRRFAWPTKRAQIAAVRRGHPDLDRDRLHHAARRLTGQYLGMVHIQLFARNPQALLGTILDPTSVRWTTTRTSRP